MFGVIYVEVLLFYFDGVMVLEVVIDIGGVIFKDFLIENMCQNDLMMFVDLVNDVFYVGFEDVFYLVLFLVYIMFEFKIVFQIGFLLFLLFFVIDFVIVLILMSFGMMMFLLIFVFLLFKLLLFVFVDGWVLIVGFFVVIYFGV